MIIHDLRCLRCEAVERDVQIRGSVYPKCKSCGGKRTWIPSKVSTDLQPEFFCEATAQTHSRHKDAELAVAKQAREFTEKTGIKWQPAAAGDRVHGARNETKFGAAFGFSGQSIRRSTAENNAEGTALPKQAPTETVGGPRRMTRQQVAAMHKSPIYTGPISTRR